MIKIILFLLLIAIIYFVTVFKESFENEISKEQTPSICSSNDVTIVINGRRYCLHKYYPKPELPNDPFYKIDLDRDRIIVTGSMVEDVGQNSNYKSKINIKGKTYLYPKLHGLGAEVIHGNVEINTKNKIWSVHLVAQPYVCPPGSNFIVGQQCYKKCKPGYKESSNPYKCIPK